MAKPNFIELPNGDRLAILYEDRSVIAVDKPYGWMLAPDSWKHTNRNLQTVLRRSMEYGDFWARSRNLKFIRFIHRLDVETTGVLLLARTPGTLNALSRLFETRQMEKIYWAVAEGVPAQKEWTCRLSLAADPKRPDRIIVDRKKGRGAETIFRVLEARSGRVLIEARPLTGRTHQLRVHLAESGLPVCGDILYGHATAKQQPLALRAVALSYRDPFTRRPVRIKAPTDDFLRANGFSQTESQ